MNWKTLTCLGMSLALPFGGSLSADTLHAVGVLGNSGEQGPSLVKFSGAEAGGLGAAVDQYGTLWDRAGQNTLIRYAVDGRALGSFKLPNVPINRNDDAIAIVGDTLFLRLGKGIYTLPVDASAGTVPKSLNVEADFMSRSAHGGYVAAAKGAEIFLVNAAAEKKPVGTFEGTLRGLELGPDLTVYPYDYNGLQRLSAGASSTRLGPLPGERPQLLDGYWYGSAWHSTLRRFDAQLRPDPGVVLGGNSGSFIGHVDEQSEVINPRGTVRVTPDLFATSGLGGVLHLLQWVPAQSRFVPVRRLGSVASCTALGLDKEGRVWHHSGNWNWNDAPTAPLGHGIPNGPAMAATMLDTDAMVGFAMIHGKASFISGKLGDELRQSQISASKLALSDAVAMTAVPFRKRRSVLILNKKGQAASYYVGTAGTYEADAGPNMLATAEPVKEWTSLGTVSPDVLVAGADGYVLQFEREGDTWKETRRWNSWSTAPQDRFGDSIHIAADAGKIWVADTTRHRVLCFDATSGKLIGALGEVDAPAEGLSAFNQPRTISARGQRAVVFDSANQRIQRLELRP